MRVVNLSFIGRRSSFIGKLVPIILLVVGLAMAGFAQSEPGTKVEVERRVKESEFPDEALQFIRAFEPKTKLRFYRQISTGIPMYEAKFRQANNRYSIEFDTLGLLINVEVEINAAQMQAEVRKSIETDLKFRFSGHSMRKIQKKWIHEDDEDDFDLEDIEVFLEEFSVSNDDLDDFYVHYEIEVRGNSPKYGRALYELIYDREGAFVSWASIQLPGMDNILF